MRRPWNNELSSASAAATDSVSANSTYANLDSRMRIERCLEYEIVVPFWMTGELVTKDRHTVDGPTRLEM